MVCLGLRPHGHASGTRGVRRMLLESAPSTVSMWTAKFGARWALKTKSIVDLRVGEAQCALHLRFRDPD